MIDAKIIDVLKWFVGGALNHVLVEQLDEHMIRFVATQGYILVQIDVKMGNIGTFAPVTFDREILYQLPVESHKLSIIGDDIYFFGDSGSITVAKNTKFEFPNYQNALYQAFVKPSNQDIDINLLSTVVKAAALFTDQFVHVMPGGSREAWVIQSGCATFGIMPAIQL